MFQAFRFTLFGDDSIFNMKSSFFMSVLKISLILGFLSLNACTYLGLQTVSVESLESEFQNQHSRYINVDGLRIHYRDEGSGPLLVLLHNELGSLNSWDTWVDELKKSYRLIRLDLPGFGLSDAPNEKQYGRSASVDFLYRFIEELDLETFTLVGSSYGGFTAWNYALDYPDNVERLVLLGPIGYTQKLPAIVHIFSTPGVEPLMNFISPKPMVATALKRGFGSQHRLTDETITRYHRMLLRDGSRTNAARFFKSIKERSKNKTVGSGIKDISVPTFIMWGEQDRWTPIEYLDRWVNDVADVQFIQYPSVGHLINEEIPEISAQDVDQYLQDNLDPFSGF